MKMTRIMRVVLTVIMLLLPVMEFAATQSEHDEDDKIVQHLRAALDIMLNDEDESETI